MDKATGDFADLIVGETKSWVLNATITTTRGVDGNIDVSGSTRADRETTAL